MKINFIMIKLCLIFSLIGCSNDDNNQEVFLGEILFNFSLQDSSENDLLDSSIEGTYNTSSISLYEKIDGQYILFDDPDSAHPKGYNITEHKGVHRFTPYYVGSHKAYSHDLKIDWGNGHIDYILVSLEDGDGDWRIIQKISYNGEIVWDRASNPDDIYFTVEIE